MKYAAHMTRIYFTSYSKDFAILHNSFELLHIVSNTSVKLIIGGIYKKNKLADFSMECAVIVLDAVQNIKNHHSLVNQIE